MRILVAIAQVPFVRRTADLLAVDLCGALTRLGHRAEIARVPFSAASPEQLLDHVVATRLMDWTGGEERFGDLLIALEFPAYLLPHPRKLLWLTEDPREWEVGASDGIDSSGQLAGDRARQAWSDADRCYLPEIRRRFAVSATVAARLKARSGLDALPLYPPLSNPDAFYWRRPEDYCLVPPGLSGPRIELLLRALAATSTPLRLKLCGQLNGKIEESVRREARRLGLEDRIDWLGEVSDDQLTRLYGSCFAVLYPALEKSLCWVALQAGLASKALLVCSDSGAPAELVQHGVSGAVVAPTADAIAAMIGEFWRHPRRTETWGRAGRAAARSPDFRWNEVLVPLLRSDGLDAAPGDNAR